MLVFFLKIVTVDLSQQSIFLVSFTKAMFKPVCILEASLGWESIEDACLIGGVAKGLSWHSLGDTVQPSQGKANQVESPGLRVQVV